MFCFPKITNKCFSASFDFYQHGHYCSPFSFLFYIDFDCIGDVWTVHFEKEWNSFVDIKIV